MHGPNRTPPRLSARAHLEGLTQNDNLVAIVSPSVPPSDERVSHPTALTAYIEKSALGRWREAFGVEGSAPPEAGRIYLLDPLGYLMMSYPLAIDPNDIRKDLARLMRVSRVG